VAAGPLPAGPPAAPARPRLDPEASWRTAATLAVRVQWLVAVACYFGLAYDRTAPYSVGALTGAIVVLGAFGWLRWQAQPASVRTAAARLPRTDRRARSIVLLTAAGALALLGVAPAAMLGELPAARAAVVVSVVATTAAAVAAGRRRAATPEPAAAPGGRR
jgi:hypothetical protein